MRTRNARYSACAVNRCPVPGKSARCRSIRPVRVLANDPVRGASQVGETMVKPPGIAADTGTLVSRGRDPNLTAGKRRSGRINWHEVLSNAVPPTWTTASILIAHSAGDSCEDSWRCLRRLRSAEHAASYHCRARARVIPAAMVVARIHPAAMSAAASQCCQPTGLKALFWPKPTRGTSRSSV
jgi:hypothetical protein